MNDYLPFGTKVKFLPCSGLKAEGGKIIGIANKTLSTGNVYIIDIGGYYSPEHQYTAVECFERNFDIVDEPKDAKSSCSYGMSINLNDSDESHATT